MQFKLEAKEKNGISSSIEFETDFASDEEAEEILKRVMRFFVEHGLELPDEIEDILYE